MGRVPLLEEPSINLKTQDACEYIKEEIQKASDQMLEEARESEDNKNLKFVTDSHLKITIEYCGFPYNMNLIDVPGLVVVDTEISDDSTKNQLHELISNLVRGKKNVNFLCIHKATEDFENCRAMDLLKTGHNDVVFDPECKNTFLILTKLDRTNQNERNQAIKLLNGEIDWIPGDRVFAVVNALERDPKTSNICDPKPIKEAEEMKWFSENMSEILSKCGAAKIRDITVKQSEKIIKNQILPLLKTHIRDAKISVNQEIKNCKRKTNPGKKVTKNDILRNFTELLETFYKGEGAKIKNDEHAQLLREKHDTVSFKVIEIYDRCKTELVDEKSEGENSKILQDIDLYTKTLLNQDICQWTPIFNKISENLVADYYNSDFRKEFMEDFLDLLEKIFKYCIEISCAGRPAMKEILTDYLTEEFDLKKEEFRLRDEQLFENFIENTPVKLICEHSECLIELAKDKNGKTILQKKDDAEISANEPAEVIAKKLESLSSRERVDLQQSKALRFEVYGRDDFGKQMVDDAKVYMSELTKLFKIFTQSGMRLAIQSFFRKITRNVGHDFDVCKQKNENFKGMPEDDLIKTEDIANMKKKEDDLKEVSEMISKYEEQIDILVKD